MMWSTWPLPVTRSFQKNNKVNVQQPKGYRIGKNERKKERKKERKEWVSEWVCEWVCEWVSECRGVARNSLWMGGGFESVVVPPITFRQSFCKNFSKNFQKIRANGGGFWPENPHTPFWQCPWMSELWGSEWVTTLTGCEGKSSYHEVFTHKRYF